MSKLRRRKLDTLSPSGGASVFESREYPLEHKSCLPSLKSSSNRLIQKGSVLYDEAEQSHFQEQQKLEQSLNMFAEAAEEGEEEAIGWISDFLNSVYSTLPATVIIPRYIYRLAPWFSRLHSDSGFYWTECR